MYIIETNRKITSQLQGLLPSERLITSLLGMIVGLDIKDSYRWTVKIKRYLPIEIAACSFEDVRVKSYTSNNLRAELGHHSDFDAQYLIQETTFDLHVFWDSPSWVSTFVALDRRLPWVEFVDPHSYVQVHVHQFICRIGQYQLDWLDSEEAASPVDDWPGLLHCILGLWLLIKILFVAFLILVYFIVVYFIFLIADVVSCLIKL